MTDTNHFDDQLRVEDLMDDAVDALAQAVRLRAAGQPFAPRRARIVARRLDSAQDAAHIGLRAIGSKVPVGTKAKLRAAADEHMHFIAANRDHVRAYFQAPIVKYAA